jgi:hypothetical protein
MDKCLRSRGTATAGVEDTESAAQETSLEIQEQCVADVECNSQNTVKEMDKGNVDGNNVKDVQLSEQLQGMLQLFMVAMQEENGKVTAKLESKIDV